MDTLPPELILYLIPFLPLTTLIAARSVNTQWRALAKEASLHPARKTLLDLYLAAIVHPQFPSLVEALRPYVREFDREAYLAGLTARGCLLPDLFEFWVLEWPSNAIHFWAWPGLPKEFEANHKQYFDGGNVLGDVSHTVERVPIPWEEGRTDVPNECLGLALWEVRFLGQGGGLGQLWLIVDARAGIHDRHAGNLFWTYTCYERVPDGTERLKRKGVLHDVPFGGHCSVFSLIDFLNLLDVGRNVIYYASEGLNFYGSCVDDDDAPY